MPPVDPRLAAFCSARVPELFDGVQHPSHVWLPDPFDVAEIHQRARDRFGRLVDQAVDGGAGRLMLLHGEPGAGKTHLMRAFRARVHRTGSAFFAYMQMTSSARHYDRYVLQKLIESLEQPYDPPREQASGLRVLSNALLQRLPAEEVSTLRDRSPDDDPISMIEDLTDQLVDLLDAPGLSVDLCRALLLLQLDQPRISRRVVKYLRAEPLSEHDARILGGMAPRHPDEAPGRVFDELRILIRQATGRALVVCADQLEDMFNHDERLGRFARAMDELKTVAEMPGTVVVVSCLNVFYDRLRQGLSESVIQRLEQDPPPTTLTGIRSANDTAQLITKRLQHLYQTCGVAPDPADPLFPLTADHVATISAQSTRRVIGDLQRLRDQAIEDGVVPAADGSLDEPLQPLPDPPADGPQRLQQEWNDYKSGLAGVEHEPPEADDALLEMLQAAIRATSDELSPVRFVVTPAPAETAVFVDVVGVEPTPERLFVALCQRPTAGGGLAKQLTRVSRAATGSTAVLVRSTPFPRTPAARAKVRRLVGAGGRAVVIEDADWRHMLALQRFRVLHADDPAGIDAFLRSEGPLSQLPSIARLLDLEGLKLAPTIPRPPTGVAAIRPLPLGVDVASTSVPVNIEAAMLTGHVALVGSTRGGRSSAVPPLIEGLLARGIPVVMVDRDGDLCGYADPSAWEIHDADSARGRRAVALRDQVDVALFTPGHPSGRGIRCPLVPEGLAGVSATEQRHAIDVSAGALSDVLGYGKGLTAERKRAALGIALLELVTSGGTPDLGALIGLLEQRSPALMNRLGTLSRYGVDLILELQALGTRKAALLGGGCEPLDAAVLFGRDDAAPSNKTRLSIVSTSFLGSPTDLQFWMTQLILEIERYVRSRPSDTLQAAILFDQADLYLPDGGGPPTHGLMIGLLQRARTAGLSILLTTQSPEDLDPCVKDHVRGWIVEGMQDSGDLDRVRPLVAQHGGDTSPPLGPQGPGELHLVGEGATVRLLGADAVVPPPRRVSEVAILTLAAALRR